MKSKLTSCKFKTQTTISLVHVLELRTPFFYLLLKESEYYWSTPISRVYEWLREYFISILVFVNLHLRLIVLNVGQSIWRTSWPRRLRPSIILSNCHSWTIIIHHMLNSQIEESFATKIVVPRGQNFTWSPDLESGFQLITYGLKQKWFPYRWIKKSLWGDLRNQTFTMILDLYTIFPFQGHHIKKHHKYTQNRIDATRFAESQFHCDSWTGLSGGTLLSLLLKITYFWTIFSKNPYFPCFKITNFLTFQILCRWDSLRRVVWNRILERRSVGRVNSGFIAYKSLALTCPYRVFLGSVLSFFLVEAKTLKDSCFYCGV